MKKKKLFSDLLKIHTKDKDKDKSKLKIDNEYILKKRDSLYFINIDFNNQEYDAQKLSVYENDQEISFREIQVFFYCCNFIKESPVFNEMTIFYRCYFKEISKDLDSALLKKCNFKTIANSLHNIEGGEIEDLLLSDREWDTKYYINKQYNDNARKTKIINLTIKNTVFKENFKLHNCEVENINIQDTDFEKHADFFKTIFYQGLIQGEQENTPISFKAINFKGLALFGDTEFKTKAIFQYVTFESFSHFRKSIFHKGLDLDYCNIQQEMNFFGIKKLETKTAKENTSQETYRIIKHNLEKIGNKIEANQYHALELSKNGKNIGLNIRSMFLKKKIPWSLLQRGMVSFIHWVSSKYSSSWVMALFWIFIAGLTTNYYLCGSEYVKFNFIFQYMSIVTNMDYFHSNYVVFLLNKISLGYLYYQFVTSIRRDTRK